MEQLTRHPHRLAGTEAGRAAADYLEQRLRSMGIEQVYPLDMTVWQHAEPDGPPTLAIGGRTLQLEALRPNVVSPPTTSAEGLRGPVYYVGDGSLVRYGDRDPAGAIVVMDYDGSGDRWEQAFALGAAAVIFLDDGRGTPPEARSAPVPRNLPRFYTTREEATAAGLDLTADHADATLLSTQPWEKRIGRNLVAVIPGTDPGFADGRGRREAVVVSAAFDSYGHVPRRSPAARRAANAAALLTFAERVVQDRPKRDVVLMFLDAESRRLQGARSVYDAWRMDEGEHQQLLKQHAAEAEWVEQALTTLTSQGPASADARLTIELRQQADWMRADVNQRLQVYRRSWQRGGAPDPTQRQDIEEGITAE